MKFTYDNYIRTIQTIESKGYVIADYFDCDRYDRCVILRHDIDTSLSKALKFAEIEAENSIKSTYFVLISSKFYNVFAKENREILQKISSLGHNIGLHFDELNYTFNCPKELVDKVHEEVNILEKALGVEIKSVSMHRPSKSTLNADYNFGNIVNSYGMKFFKGFKYVSDSRRMWREELDAIVDRGEYDKLHILTHAFWYNEIELSLEEEISNFINSANYDRYNILEQNITDLESIMKREDVR